MGWGDYVLRSLKGEGGGAEEGLKDQKTKPVIS